MLRSNFDMKAPFEKGEQQSIYQQSVNYKNKPHEQIEYGHANTEKDKSHIRFGTNPFQNSSESQSAFSCN